ncbi:MAG: hypothetical protein RLZZ440_1053 [Planctomycetota bacterium]
MLGENDGVQQAYRPLSSGRIHPAAATTMPPCLTVMTPRGPIEVDIDPLNSGALLQTPLPPRISETDGQFVLEYHRGLRILGLVFLAAGAAMTSVGVFIGRNLGWPQPHSAMFLGMGLLFLPCVGIVMIAAQSRWVFLPAAGLYRRASLLNTTAWPLDHVVAVQTTFGGVHEGASGGPDSPGPGCRMPCFQLNLVLNAPGRPGSRRNLTNLPDRAFVTQAGERLASFLGIPWVDTIDESRAHATAARQP